MTLILGTLQDLATQGRRVRLNWIPSHVGVQGNEAADQGPTVTQQVHPSLQQTKAQARRTAALHTHEHHQELEAAKRQAAWYAAATAYHSLEASHQRSRADGVLLQRVRLGFCSREELEEDFTERECEHCGSHTRRPLVHYILSCLATARLRPLPTPTAHPVENGLLRRCEARAALTIRMHTQTLGAS